MKTNLTDFQAWCITNAISTWNAKNKASEKPFLDIDFFKKLFGINTALRNTFEAVQAAGMTVDQLYAKKDASPYELPLLSEEEFKRMVDGPDTYEVFSWIKE